MYEYKKYLFKKDIGWRKLIPKWKWWKEPGRNKIYHAAG